VGTELTGLRALPEMSAAFAVIHWNTDT